MSLFSLVCYYVTANCVSIMYPHSQPLHFTERVHFRRQKPKFLAYFNLSSVAGCQECSSHAAYSSGFCGNWPHEATAQIVSLMPYCIHGYTEGDCLPFVFDTSVEVAPQHTGELVLGV